MNVKNFITIIFILFCILVSSIEISNATSAAQCTNQIRGINLAGAEFSPNSLPGVNGLNYKFPSVQQLKYYKKNGFNATRLPLLWERLQPSLFGPLDTDYSKLILNYMDSAQQAGLVVVIDIHNYARYRNQLIGSPNVPKDSFQDLWKKTALLLKNHPALFAYGLMNEPHNTSNTWHNFAQFGVDGIREVDGGHFIYVSGDSWSSAAFWPTANPAPFVNDSSNKIVYEAHVYFDNDYSGRYVASTINVDLNNRVEERLRPFIKWLKDNKQKGVIGEWGIPTNDSNYNDAAGKFLDLADTECLDWFVWAGGQWSANYNLSLEPHGVNDVPLLKLIKSRISGIH